MVPLLRDWRATWNQYSHHNQWNEFTNTPVCCWSRASGVYYAMSDHISVMMTEQVRAGETGRWSRTCERVAYEVVEDNFVLSFSYKFTAGHAHTYFAFSQPFSYTDSQNMLRELDARWMGMLSDTVIYRFKTFIFCCFMIHFTTAAPSEGTHHEHDIYYHRDLLTFSLDGNRVDLVTISSRHLITERVC